MAPAMRTIFLGALAAKAADRQNNSDATTKTKDAVVRLIGCVVIVTEFPRETSPLLRLRRGPTEPSAAHRRCGAETEKVEVNIQHPTSNIQRLTTHNPQLTTRMAWKAWAATFPASAGSPRRSRGHWGSCESNPDDNPRL